MRLFALFALAFAPIIGQAAAADSVYAPLWWYQGTWHVTRKDAPAGSKPDELINQCALVGQYFVCQQTVNKQPGALLIFIPAKQAGQYLTQNVRPDGRASSIGNLEISGNRWTYSSRWDQGAGKTTFYRTTNVFSGKNRIHFEQAESPNGKDWTITGSGDEVRVSGANR